MDVIRRKIVRRFEAHGADKVQKTLDRRRMKLRDALLPQVRSTSTAFARARSCVAMPVGQVLVLQRTD